jgi:hypothetical protein
VEQNPVKNFLEYSGELKDPRAKSANRRELHDILIIAVCAVTGGCNTRVDIARLDRSRL